MAVDAYHDRVRGRLAGGVGAEDVTDRVARTPLLVEDRHDHGDGGASFVVRRVTANGGQGRAAAVRCDGPPIVWAYGVLDSPL